jgi:type IX secretion system PorP/SprF family membrane protein
MNKILNFLRIIVMFVFTTQAFGQQDPQFTQNSDNMLFVNPAYAGSRGVLNLTAMHREQWVGFEGRPVSSTFSAHSPLSYQSVGLGLTIVNDQTGPIKQTMMYGDFSYTLKFKNQERKLSFGIKGGFNMISIGTSTLQTTEVNDPKLLQNVRNNINPNIGFGVYFHSPRFFIGASSPKLLERGYDGISKVNLEKRHYFGIIGGVFPINNHWKIRPTTQIKLTEKSPISIDASVAAIYKERIWFGGMYRLNAAFGVFAQYQVSPQFKLGIASDFGTQAIRNYNYGTFEVLISYDFVFKKVGLRSPRYF